MSRRYETAKPLRRKDDTPWVKSQDTFFPLGFNHSLKLRSTPEGLTADAGVVLLREVGERLGLWKLLDRALLDLRDPELITHPFAELLRTAVLLAAQGWSRQRDVDFLRRDPAFRLAVSKRRGESPLLARRHGREPEGLASQATLSRLMAALGEPENRKTLDSHRPGTQAALPHPGLPGAPGPALSSVAPTGAGNMSAEPASLCSGGLGGGAPGTRRRKAQPTRNPSSSGIMETRLKGWITEDNISAYHRGMMGGTTPNIDRLAAEGALFTDHYAQQSCTAGRAAFITGQSSYRTGLLTIGMPGADQGLQAQDPTIAELLKPLGYATGQFGKNHLGDLDEFLPTNHGFDEFFGNLYHLNAEEEPETYHYPTNPEFHEEYGPRGVLHTYADGRIEDTGPLTRERMETADQEFVGSALDFMEGAVNRDEPFFVWLNSTRMHVWPHLSDEWYGKTGYGIYQDGMAELDYYVGMVLDKLDEWGIADNTIVVFSTDNGAEVMSWPDGGTIPFRGEKGTTWEGGFRVPQVVRWPGVIEPGTVYNDIMSHEDWLPTFVAAAGDPDVKEKLLTGHQAGDKNFRVHLDGYNFMPYFSGETDTGPRREIFYFDAAGNLNALRIDDWKASFSYNEGDITTAFRVSPSWPIITNLRMDPFERAYFESRMYIRWMADQMWTFVPAQAFVEEFLGTFVDYPPSQPVGSLSVDQVLEKLKAAQTRGGG